MQYKHQVSCIMKGSFFRKSNFIIEFYFLIIKVKSKTNMIRRIECIKVIQIIELEPFLDYITILHPEFI